MLSSPLLMKYNSLVILHVWMGVNFLGTCLTLN